jgi:hypothetical protein
MTDCFGNVAWFFRIKGARLAFADGAETAMACADVSAKHEGRGAIGPAFKNVRTARFLTDGVQVQTLD